MMNGSKDGRRRRSRPRNSVETPPPPPPPPDSLVALLWSDKNVLDYFQALQTSLDADVRRWKHRAKDYKEQCEQLQTQLSELSSRKRPARKKAKTTTHKKPPRKPEKSTARQPSSNAAASASPKAVDHEEIVPIDDSIFDISDDDSVDGVELMNKEVSNTKREDINRNETYELLCEAYRCLERLGVALTTEDIGFSSSTGDTNADKPSATNSESDDAASTQLGDVATAAAASGDDGEEAAFTPSLIRRSDNDVLVDVIHALRTLSQIHILAREAKSYDPFSTQTLIPRYFDEEALSPVHPVRNGLACAFSALSIMRMHCTSHADNQWDSIFHNKGSKTDKMIRIGMCNRHDMVELLVDTIKGELSNAWSATDRSTRLVTTALHYTGSRSETEKKSENDAPADSTVHAFGSKSQSRLALLLERCIYARLLRDLNIHWGQPEETVKLVLEYILSTCPSLGIENYPKLPPVLSFCVVEALICRKREVASGSTDDQLFLLSGEVSWFARFLSNMSHSEKNVSLATRALVLTINTAACIWEERLHSEDDRISDMSQVELACYNRLLESESSWLFRTADSKTVVGCLDMAMSIISESLEYLLGTDKHVEETSRTDQDDEYLGVQVALQLALTLAGDEEVVDSVLLRSHDTFRESVAQAVTASGVQSAFLAGCVAYRQHNVRQLDTFRKNRGVIHFQTPLIQPFAKSDDLAKIKIDSYRPDLQLDWDFASSMAQCIVQLASGEALYALMHWVVYTSATKDKDENQKDKDEHQMEPSSVVGNSRKRQIANALAVMLKAGEIPTVRVINLRRRQDRLASFMAQAQRDQLLVARAVAKLDVVADALDSSESTKPSGAFWGEHAFDGRGRAAEVDASLSTFLEAGTNLSDLVETHWRPNDLKAFDRDARDDDAMVMMSGSERACALSHIASWKGVARSLTPSVFQGLESEIFPHAANTLRLFRISGFARGAPLLHDNLHMSPAPVCVVLEDDAILVDRFVERLASVLEELPRDFHFCSLGYSRPRTAPIVKYSSQLGIPSCIWYLTGYILSLEGADMLMDSLPVKGPVDSWIGLKMCSNWDNMFGHNVGVGIHSRPLADPPPRKDLVQILKFRAFCALSPLCSQKVGTASSLQPTSGRTWRQRDTDITYSGNS